jgi:hypothetical protein
VTLLLAPIRSQDFTEDSQSDFKIVENMLKGGPKRPPSFGKFSQSVIALLVSVSAARGQFGIK